MTPQSRIISTLLTRPQAQSDRFAAILTEYFGHRLSLTISPLIAPHFLRTEILSKTYTALILTSETGALSTIRHLNLPTRAYCVGDRTAVTARSLGLNVLSADGDANALISLILSSAETGPLLHPRGQDSCGDIAATLTARAIPVDEVITYDQRPQALSYEALALLNGALPVLLPLFSSRTAMLLASQGPFRAPLWIAPLSPAVAQAAAPLCPVRQATADAPNADALLTAISRIIDASSA